jgi:hypothetical protein
MTTTDERTPYQIANDITTIFTAMQMCDMEVPDFDYGTMKVDCPFDEERAFRVYAATNSAYCFACSKKYTPVSLIAEHRGITIEEAARTLLETAGWTPPTPDARWDALMSASVEIDRPSEAEALKMFCARIDPEWSTRQFEERIAALLTKCLEPLDKVHTTEDLHLWRSTTRRIMTTALTPQGAPHG